MYTVKNAICKEWKECLKEHCTHITIGKNTGMFLFDVCKKQWLAFSDISSSKQLYNILVKKNFVNPSSMFLWNTKLSDKSIIWKNVYTHKFHLVKEQTIVAFNFKL